MPHPMITAETPASQPRFTPNQRRGFLAAWGGVALDGVDSFIYALVLVPALRGLLPKLEDFKSSRVAIVAVGPMTPAEAKAFDLPFPVLSDPDLEATKKYGLVHEKGMLNKDVPRPTTLLIDKERKIRWMRAETSVRIRPDPEEVFEQLKK